jgi:hypothetical protein
MHFAKTLLVALMSFGAMAFAAPTENAAAAPAAAMDECERISSHDARARA